MGMVSGAPYHSHTRFYVECTDFCQIHSNPIGRDNRMAVVQDSDWVWVCYGRQWPISNPHNKHIWAIAFPIPFPNLDHICPIPFDSVRVAVLYKAQPAGCIKCRTHRYFHSTTFKNVRQVE